MKIILFAIGVLALVQGLELEEGSTMCVEFDGEGDELSIYHNRCQGTVEIRSELNGIEKFHGKFVKKERDTAPLKVRMIRYIPQMERGETKTIQVNGNCCWRFYRR